MGPCVQLGLTWFGCQVNFPTLVSDIRALTGSAQAAAVRTADCLLALRSGLIGAWIGEYEQNCEDRAAHGEALIERFAEELDRNGGRGLSARNHKNFRRLALTRPDLDAGRTALAILGPIRQTPSAEFDGPEIQHPTPEDLPELGLLPLARPAVPARTGRQP